MKWPKKYKCVPKEFVLQINEFKLVPIRYQDRYLIMKWRNEQLYHLRQESLLTKNIKISTLKILLRNNLMKLIQIKSYF